MVTTFKEVFLLLVRGAMHFVLLIFMFVCAVEPKVDGQDILEEMYHSMGGEYWHRIGYDYTTWTSGWPACFWDGITCNTPKGISNIDIRYSNISGTLPQHGWNFPELLSLYVLFPV